MATDEPIEPDDRTPIERENERLTDELIDRDAEIAMLRTDLDKLRAEIDQGLATLRALALQRCEFGHCGAPVAVIVERCALGKTLVHERSLLCRSCLALHLRLGAQERYETRVLPIVGPEPEPDAKPSAITEDIAF